jgi:hypothetical protein
LLYRGLRMTDGLAALRAGVAAAVLAALATGCGSRPAGPAATAAAFTVPASASRLAAAVRGYGPVTRALPRCTTATRRAPELPASDTALTRVPGQPFGVSVLASDRVALVSVSPGVFALRIGPGRVPRPFHRVLVPTPTVGSVLVPGDRYLLTANGSDGAEVLRVRAVEQGRRDAVLGDLSFPGQRESGAIEVAVTPDGHYAFVSLEDARAIAVYDLQRALTRGFGRADFVGLIPAQLAPVGLAVAPDGRWLYSTSEGERRGTEVGSLSVISVARAERDPARSVVARAPAGCNPVRVVTSADGATVWVTARASDALLAFSARALRADPRHALLADVRVGELPVGLALARSGSLVVVADSNRLHVAGAHSSLAIVDVQDALAGRPALLGYLRAGLFPRDMADTADGSVLVVSDFASRQVETVDLARLP